jgi:adhesin HecA-like repeat protein
VAGSTISNLVTISVTLGSGSYPSPLTITSTGTIDPSAGGLIGATGLVAAISAGYVLNQGIIVGAEAATGGIGIDLAGGSLTNKGRITGGSASSSGGVAGLGAHVASSSLTNDGTITGGYGANYINSYATPGGAGGGGVDLISGSLTNTGLIAGGSGGEGHVNGSGAVGGSGGIGLDVTSSSLTNDGTIVGGAGGFALSLGGTGTGGAGGIGVSLGAGSVLINDSTIAGGNGGDANLGTGGAAGAGVDVTSGSLTNDGTIVGGYGGIVGGSSTNAGGTGGAGGAGVSLADGGTLTNGGVIAGGSGGETFGGTSGSGGSGVDVANSSLTNNGTIAGGYGGYSVGEQAAGTAGSGGSGVAITSGSLTNAGRIAGGIGGLAVKYSGAAGGTGGTGIDASSSSLTNDGTIAGGNGGEYGSSGSGGGAGVYLGAGSRLTNMGGITGGTAGQGPAVYGRGGYGVAAKNSSLTNDGTITGGSGGSAGYGVDATGSTVTNNGAITGGTLIGARNSPSFGTAVELTSSTLINTGSIVGAYDGVSLSSGGLVSNAASAVIAGYNGVMVSGAGTVINAGTIAAGNYRGVGLAAVSFIGAGTDLLVVDPGAVFDGSVVAHGSPATLEFASAAGAGTIAGIGSSFTGFGTLAVDADANWSVTSSVTGGGMFDLAAGSDLTFNGGVAATSTVHFTAATGTLGLDDPADFASTVYGLQPGDAFDFTSITSIGTIVAGVDPSNHLTLTSDGILLTEIQLDPAQSFANYLFHAAPDSGAGTLVTETPLCFLTGTMIATPCGEVPIEQLAVGDMVLTARGDARPTVWIGTGRVLATRGRRNAATPVIVRKGALADNVPHHDLRVTKAHSLYLEGALIPVEFLVNHRSVQWDDLAQEVTLYHVELESHDVLLANGAPAESYRDDGNRWLFRNANSGWDLPPQPPYTAVLTDGPVVDAAWRRLSERAGAHSSLPLTDDPDLHLLVDGRRLDVASQHGAWRVFRLASRPGSVRIVSRAGVPQELGLARDPRSLGVALRLIMARQGTRVRTITASDSRLTDGFHAFEADNDIRWTNGDAVLPTGLLDDFDIPCEIVLRLGGSTRYVDEGTMMRPAA